MSLNADAFADLLRREGYDVSTVERAAGGLDTHTHPFEARALILSGEIVLTVDGVETTYRPGDVFVLPSGREHVERYGPQGVRYVVGRK